MSTGTKKVKLGFSFMYVYGFLDEESIVFKDVSS